MAALFVWILLKSAELWPPLCCFKFYLMKLRVSSVSRTARCPWSTESGPAVRRWRWATRSRTDRTAPAGPGQRATRPATKPEVPLGLRPRPRLCRAPVRPLSPPTRSCRTAPVTWTGPRQPPPRHPAAPSRSAAAATSRGRFLWTARRPPPDDAGTVAQLILFPPRCSFIV